MGYRVILSGADKIPMAGTREAQLSEARARADLREGRYETFQTAEDLVRSLRERVGGSLPVSAPASAGTLAPRSKLHLRPSLAKVAMQLDFFIGGKLVASQTFSREPAQVTLREEEGKFRIDVETDEQAGLEVSQASS